MRLALDGGSLQYEIADGGPETLILIPALGMTGGMWQQQVEHFHSEYTVVTYDAGHVASGAARPDVTLEDFADELATLLDAVGTVAAHLLGISMGGMIGQCFAVKYADRVKSLVLVSTTPSYPEESRNQMRQRAGTAEEQGIAPLAGPTMERWFTAGFRRSHPDVVERIRQMLLSANPAAYAAAARAVAALDTVADLPRIRAHTLVMTEEHDPSMPPGAAETLARGIPDSRLVTIPDAAHLCNVENPTAFNREVSRFLREVAASLPDDPGLHAPASPW